MGDDTCIDGEALARLRRIGKEKLLHDMIDLFLQHAPNWISTAPAGQQTGDFESLERAAHSLKSSAGNMGARAVQELARKIEHLAEEKNHAAIAPLLDELD